MPAERVESLGSLVVERDGLRSVDEVELQRMKGFVSKEINRSEGNAEPTSGAGSKEADCRQHATFSARVDRVDLPPSGCVDVWWTCSRPKCCRKAME